MLALALPGTPAARRQPVLLESSSDRSCWRAYRSSLARNNVHDLLPALRHVATPFRLMELPPELRLSIFEFALQKGEPIVLLSTISKFRREGPPALLDVSRKVQDEALPIYYSINKFKMFLDLSVETLSHLPSLDVAEWAADHEDAAKHLRHLTIIGKSLEFPLLGKNADLAREITVRYSPHTGIQLELSTDLNRACLSEYAYKGLLTHREVVEGYWKAKGLEGEAVALFFRTGHRDWDRMREEAGAVAMRVENEKL